MEESELIDNYLRGELIGDEMESFITLMYSNEELRKKVTIRRLVLAGISASYAEDLKQKLANYDRSLESKKRFGFSWKMAAAFTLLIATGVVLYLSVTKPDPYAFDIPDPGLPNMMGATNNIEFNNAMSIFKAGNYLTADQTFSKMLASHPANDTLLYYSGLCDFRVKKTEAAIEKWATIETNSEFIEKTEYRLAIAYWVKGDKKLAAYLLERIAGIENHSLSQSAKEALETLN
jgi:tetratricopeptide (TPR) repeat protein